MQGRKGAKAERHAAGFPSSESLPRCGVGLVVGFNGAKATYSIITFQSSAKIQIETNVLILLFITVQFLKKI